MTKKMYTIGELSKVCNLSIQTLRYYDKIDLLKPAYVDSSTNYRYYMESQIHYIDLIKSLKFIGTPLEQIKFAQGLTTEQLLDFLNEQEAIVEKKVKRMQEIQYILKKTKKQMEDQLNIPVFNNVYQSFENPKRLLSIKTNTLKINENADAYYQVLTKIIEQEGGVMNNRYGGIYPIKNYNQLSDMVYDSICIPLLSKKYISHEEKDVEIITMPAGNYVSIAFQFEETNYFEHYKKLYNYIKAHELNVEPRIYEFFMPTKYTSDETPSLITELKIKRL